MKKIAVFILALLLLTLTACGGATEPYRSASWKDGEKLTYRLSVVPDATTEANAEKYSGYTYKYEPDGVSYSVRPDAEKSTGEYTTRIAKTGSDEYTVTTTYNFTAVYPKDTVIGGTEFPGNSDFRYFENTTESTAVYSGLFGAMKSSVKTVSVTDVTAKKTAGVVVYSTEKIEYRIDAKYQGGKYVYELNTKDKSGNYTEKLYDFKQSGSFSAAAGTIDNEVLFYYIRSIQLTPANFASVNISKNVPDPFTGAMAQLNFSAYSSTLAEITPDSSINILYIDPIAPPEGGKYNCAHIVVGAVGSRPGHGIHLYYALNDGPHVDDPSGNRLQQKLMRIQQTYIQFDLIKTEWIS